MNYASLRPLLFALPAECAHHLAITALRYGLVPAQPAFGAELLHQTLWGLHFENPVGLAAGFDKNAEAVKGLHRQGFGFLELGTVTPKPQEGNPRPRLFRLAPDEAVINRLGFNNNGLERFCGNLATARKKHPQAALPPLGVNIGKNKDTEQAVEDYLLCLEQAAPLADYITINISSPNTAGLRDLQGKHHLEKLLASLIAKRDTLPRRVPLLLKIAPDLTAEDRSDIASIVLEQKIDGLIVSNTTVDRPLTLQCAGCRREKGGLSGKPLMQPSTAMLGEMYRLTGGRIPLIGAGGIASGADAYAKIRQGASLVQLYTALIYQGFGLVTRIKHELAELLARDGFASLRDAVGVDVKG